MKSNALLVKIVFFEGEALLDALGWRKPVGNQARRQDQKIIDAIQSYMFGSEHPDLVGYRTQSLERDLKHKDLFIWGMRRLCRLGAFYNKRILDVGCGFGWQALSVSMIGNNSVVALDILPSMIEGARECVETLHTKDFVFDVSPVCGDICDVDLPANSFDGIYSIEAIEHVHDIGQMFDNCARLLKKGGTLLIVNDSNALNRDLRKNTIDMWRKRENSWEWISYLKSIRPIEHGEAQPFSVMRRVIVENARPALDEASIDLIVKSTAGMLRNEIEALAKQYKSGCELPVLQELDWCRNPLTGEYAERLLDPFAMADMLKQRGFFTKVRHGFRRQPLRLLNAIKLRPLNIALFNLRPNFILYAEKHH